MGIRKDEMIQVTTFSKETIEKIQATVAEAQKKQTLTYKIKNFFKNILKFKKQLLTLQKMTIAYECGQVDKERAFREEGQFNELFSEDLYLPEILGKY